MHRREAQRELAQHYKERIGEKEKAKANAYSAKRDNGTQSDYFPFVEGEAIKQTRAAKSANMREEMRDFLKHQRDTRPERVDAKGNDSAAFEAGVYIAASPRFLNRAQAHMSRRLEDGHVRKVLEDKVLAVKLELERQAQQKETERQQWEDGLLVNDALRYDKDQAKMTERKRNAQCVLDQIDGNKKRVDRERQATHSEPAYYWGPEEKQAQQSNVHREHCAHLIRQMEVDQTRRLDSRGRRLQQERRIIENSLADMAQDRKKEKTKHMRQREVLTTTWQSQQKIKQALSHLEEQL